MRGEGGRYLMGEKMPDEEGSGGYPFSPADWVMFLNWEISDRRMQSLVAAGMVAIGILAFPGGIVFMGIGIIRFGVVGCMSDQR